MLSLVLSLDPVPASRPRVSSKGWAYYPKRYKDYKAAATAALKRQNCVGGKFGGPIEVMVEFVVQRPKTTKLLHPKPDIDNYMKAIFDACNDIVWIDDCQIVRVTAEKRWTNEGEDPHTKITIKQL